MIVVTGAAGFIGSCVAKDLTETYSDQVVLVDDFSRIDKTPNLTNVKSLLQVDRNDFFEWAEDKDIRAIIHLGARTDTTEFNWDIFQKLNIDYTKSIWKLCERKQTRLIYASSAATYGAGELGYKDDHEVVSSLKPLNPYGESKNDIDEWILNQPQTFPWYGLKFFNVYGPNEYHKGRMASVVLHAFNQVSSNGALKLFRSHNADFKNGEQLRDFIYVKDVSKVIDYLMNLDGNWGLYNLGTGRARTFIDLGKSVFKAMGIEPIIDFIDTPIDIRDKYQYYTEADMSKLKSTGYKEEFYDLETGIQEYVESYLKGHKSY
ncbi:ADP-glyceromanno-heptose 6-epimerase [Salibacteraceae bacterium]|nr:ADP-glyceromanno-heptose 6-epimerase [Salibacteraceae bacterium]